MRSDSWWSRRCAQALGIGIRGTLGLVILAKQIASVPSARPVVEHLRRVGLFLTDDVANQASALVGE
jgi:predicted nucleic acid-binding protein